MGIKYSPDMLGLIADMHSAEGKTLALFAVQETMDQGLNVLRRDARQKGTRYILAAGLFDNKSHLFTALCKDEEELIAAFETANTRMAQRALCPSSWQIESNALDSFYEAFERNAKTGLKGSGTTYWCVEPPACRARIVELAGQEGAFYE